MYIGEMRKMKIKEALKEVFFHCRGKKGNGLSFYNLRCICCFFISFLYRNLNSIFLGHVISERGTEIPWVLKSIQHKEKKEKVLILGTCESLFSVYLATLFDDVYGVDIRRYNEKHPNLHVICADMMNLPFNANTFDVVISISTLEHIGLGAYGDPCSKRGDHIALEEIKRVIRDKGKVLITVPAGRDYVVSNTERVYSPQEIENIFSIFPKVTYEYSFNTKGIFREAISKEDIEKRRYKQKWGLACITAELIK